MSIYATNEYIVSSNNSMNDNKYNSQKAAKGHHYGIRAVLKPLLKMLKKNKKQQQQQKLQQRTQEAGEHCYYCAECDDNSANEELESSLIEEGQWGVEGGRTTTSATFVPVHFARTEAGTFFWTSSLVCGADSDLSPSPSCFTQCQDAAEQMPIVFQDRWVQA